MAHAAKVFRLFVSSTFDDLKAERNALQERVFPELRKLCEQYDLLELMGIPRSPATVTWCRLYRFDLRSYAPELSARCPWCGDALMMTPGVLASLCPHCHEPLRFNPFIVDNRAEG